MAVVSGGMGACAGSEVKAVRLLSREGVDTTPRRLIAWRRRANALSVRHWAYRTLAGTLCPADRSMIDRSRGVATLTSDDISPHGVGAGGTGVSVVGRLWCWSSSARRFCG